MVAAVNAAGEQRKVEMLTPGQEIELELPGVSDENGIRFGDVVSVGGEPPAQEPAEGDGEPEAAEEPAEEPEAESDAETPREAPPGLSIGRAVTYRSRTGDYDVPAVVTATVDTLNPKGVESGNVPALSEPDCVHLTVFTPGKPGLREGAEDFKSESEHGRSENVAGCYQEWDIPQFEVAERGAEDEACEIVAGTWRWPERV